MANLYDPDTWGEFPEEIKNKLYQMRELFLLEQETEAKLQEEPE